MTDSKPRDLESSRRAAAAFIDTRHQVATQDDLFGYDLSPIEEEAVESPSADLMVPWRWPEPGVVNFTLADPDDIAACLERAERFATWLWRVHDLHELLPCWPKHPDAFMVLYDLAVSHQAIYSADTPASDIMQYYARLASARTAWANSTMKRCDETTHKPRTNPIGYDRLRARFSTPETAPSRTAISYPSTYETIDATGQVIDVDYATAELSHFDAGGTP
jgi:hypothetical protein